MDEGDGGLDPAKGEPGGGEEGLEDDIVDIEDVDFVGVIGIEGHLNGGGSFGGGRDDAIVEFIIGDLVV